MEPSRGRGKLLTPHLPPRGLLISLQSKPLALQTSERYGMHGWRVERSQENISFLFRVTVLFTLSECDPKAYLRPWSISCISVSFLCFTRCPVTTGWAVETEATPILTTKLETLHFLSLEPHQKKDPFPCSLAITSVFFSFVTLIPPPSHKTIL